MRSTKEHSQTLDQLFSCQKRLEFGAEANDGRPCSPFSAEAQRAFRCTLQHENMDQRKDPSCSLRAGKQELGILELNIKILEVNIKILVLKVQIPDRAWPPQRHPAVTPPATLLLCLTSGKDREQI